MQKITKQEFNNILTNKFGSKISLLGGYNSYTKDTQFICNKHGIFVKSPQRVLLTKCGCPKCGKNLMAKTQSLGLDEFIEKSNSIHNNKYDYSKFIYTTNKTKSTIICPKHGEFEQRPDKHMNGQGCPKCKTERNHTAEVIQKQSETKRKNKTFNKSKPEDDIYKYLIQEFSNDDVHRNYSSSKYPFNCDFYIKSLDLYIECNFHWTHGKHWYNENNYFDNQKLELWQNRNTKFYDNAIKTWTIRDTEKRKTAKENNLNYLVLWTPEEYNYVNLYENHKSYINEYSSIKNNHFYSIKHYLKSHGIKYNFKDNCFILTNFIVQIGQQSNNIEIFDKYPEYDIFTIFPWNDISKCLQYIEYKLNLIKQIKYYARKLETKFSNILTKELRDFIDKYHILGKVKHSNFVGCSYFEDNGQVLGLATFIKDKKGKIELKRLLFKNNINIVGGAGKLIKDFCKQYKIKELYTYSDRNISNGNVYKQIGFTKINTNRPQKIFYNSELEHKFSESSLWQVGADRLLKHKISNYKEIGIGKGLPGNEDIVLNYNYDIYLDCGNDYWKLEI